MCACVARRAVDVGRNHTVDVAAMCTALTLVVRVALFSFVMGLYVGIENDVLVEHHKEIARGYVFTASSGAHDALQHGRGVDYKIIAWDYFVVILPFRRSFRRH